MAPVPVSEFIAAMELLNGLGYDMVRMADGTSTSSVLAMVPAELSIDIRYEGNGPSTLSSGIVHTEKYMAIVGTGHISEHAEAWADTREEAIVAALVKWRAGKTIAKECE